MPDGARDWRDDVLDVLGVFWLTMPSAVLSMLALLLTARPDQSLEAARVLAEQWATSGVRAVLHLVALLAAAVGASLVAWYWARVALYLLAPDAHQGSAARRVAARELPRLWGITPMLGLSWAFLRAARSVSREGAGASGLAARLGVLMVVALLAAVALYVFYRVRRRLLGHATPFAPGGSAAGHAPSVRTLPRATRSLLAVSLAVWVVLFALDVSSYGQRYAGWGPVTVLLLSIGTWIPVAGTLMYAGARRRLPLVRLVLAWGILLAWLDCTDNHDVRVASRGAMVVPAFGDALATWLDSRADAARWTGADYPVVIVAAEGGGLRAAYFTAQTLGALQDRCPRFAQHVLAISGVSGGSVGAAVFDALVARRVEQTAGAACADSIAGAPGTLQRSGAGVLSRDLLTPVFAHGLYAELAQRFIPVPIGIFDRARALEVSVEHAWAGVEPTTFPRSFYGLRADTGAAPALFLNTTRVETGERMAVASSRVDPARFPGLETLAGVNDSIDVRLSTAAVLSARFPYVTPEGVVVPDRARAPAGSRWRYVDGGYFDETGIATALQIAQAARAEAARRGRRIAVLVVRIGFTEREKSDTGMGGLKYTGSKFDEVLSPVRALLNVRAAHGAGEIERLRTLADTARGRGAALRLAEFQLTRDSVPLILGWLLSDRARAEMACQVTYEPACGERLSAGNDAAYETVREMLEGAGAGTAGP